MGHGDARHRYAPQYEAACNWKLIVENFSECYHCPSVHPELTTVLPEFKRGQGTLHQAGYGAAYGEGIGGFTFDGRPGLPPLPGLARRTAAATTAWC